MRFYDYRCQNPECNQVKEFHEPTNADTEKHICQCGSEMKRIISSPPAFGFKSKPAGYNLSATERKRRWNSSDPRDKV
jgi:predicted nucleic acid-binding Zn ribbon protein